MRKRATCVALLLLLIAAPVYGAGVGLGASLQSAPVGGALSVSGRIHPRWMLDGRLAPLFGDTNQLFLALDTLGDIGGGFDTGAGRIQPFVGGGVRGAVIDTGVVGVEAPLGVRYRIPDAPLWLTLIVAPVVDIDPGGRRTRTQFLLDARFGFVVVVGQHPEAEGPDVGPVY